MAFSRHAVGVHAALDQVDVQVDEPAHLDRAAEGDLPVALAEVQVAHGQVRPVDEDGVEDPGALGEVLDVLVAAVLPRGCGAGGLGGGVGERLTLQGAQDRVLGQGRQGQRRDPVRVGGDQVALALVPPGQQLLGRGGAHQAGVDDAGEGDPGHVPGGGLAAGEVPDHLVGVGELLGQEPAAVLGGEDAGVAPALAGQRAGVLLRDRADVEDVDDQQVSGLGALDPDRAGEHVHRRQRRVADVVGGVVVVDRPVEPLPAVDPDRVPGLDLDLRREWRSANGCGR